jgi:hypothetical protein
MGQETHTGGAAQMTDTDLNRLVAAARGWTEITNNDPYGRLVGLIPDGSRADFLPDVASDPGAWGGLMEEIAANDCDVALESDWHPDKKWTEWIAVVWRDKVKYVESDLRPGRALALAFLASKGISTD